VDGPFTSNARCISSQRSADWRHPEVLLSIVPQTIWSPPQTKLLRRSDQSSPMQDQDMPTERAETEVQAGRLDTEVQTQLDKLLGKVVHDQVGGLLRGAGS
jgi:hypothetical protein